MSATLTQLNVLVRLINDSTETIRAIEAELTSQGKTMTITLTHEQQALVDEGIADYQDGIDHDHCPYPEDSAAWVWWIAGWWRAYYANKDITFHTTWDLPREGEESNEH